MLGLYLLNRELNSVKITGVTFFIRKNINKSLSSKNKIKEGNLFRSQTLKKLRPPVTKTAKNVL
jgi:hypothetical protein